VAELGVRGTAAELPVYRRWMTAQRGTAIKGTAMATAVAVALSAAGRAGSAGPSKQTATPTATPITSRPAASERPRGIVEDCSTRSEARFPGAFTNPRNVVVGPLVLIGAGGTPGWSRTSGGNKFPLLVRAGHRVTVELSTRTRMVAGLAYGPLPEGEVHLRDAHRVVTFIACRRGERSGSSADGRPVTFWSGGVLARSPRCVPLLVWVDAAPSPRRVVIRFGVRPCG
jgi:hypothetical protein